jgi:dipicolinate synthase subunit A
MDEVIGALWPGALVLGGGFAEATLERALREKLRMEDFLRRPDFLQANAAITAEGAIGVLLRESEKTLLGSNCLVAGWGRIGRLLALRLAALGAHVTVAARRRADRAEAEALGLRALDYGQLESVAGELDLVVNTVPARALADALLCCLPGDALLLELASPPGGFDPLLAQNIGLRALAAPGLPGKSAPASAAALIRRTAAQILSEQEE